MKPHKYRRARNPAWKGRCGFGPEGKPMEACRKFESDPIHQIRPEHSKTAITCPFGPHAMPVWVLENDLIEQHTLGFFAMVELKDLTCPASLMHWPLTDASKAALAQQAKDIAQQFRRDIDKEWDSPPPARGGPGESQSLRGPHRAGREPEPGSDDWGIGGRAHEDIIPEDQTVTPPVPPSAAGHSMGRGSGVSISETAATAQRAITIAEEAFNDIQNAQQKLNQARGMVVEILGDGQSATLQDWLTMLNQSERMSMDAKSGIPIGNEFGRRFIANLFS